MIKVSNVSVNFPAARAGECPVRALDAVSLHCARGRITGILGANGAGKSTLMRTIAGLIRPTAGETQVGGMATACSETLLRERIGFVTPEGMIFDRLTPYETLHFIARIRGISKFSFEDRVRTLSAQLGIRELLHRCADNFSTGQHRKVSLAVALLHRPDVLLFDEPTSGLDIPSAADLGRFLRAEAERGCTIVLATHSHAEVASLCDDLHILRTGRVQASDTPGALAAAHPSGRLDFALADMCRDTSGAACDTIA